MSDYCSVDGCTRPASNNGYCGFHFIREKVEQQASTCSVDRCENEAKRGGLCWGHRKRKSRQQTVDVPLADPKGGKHKKGLSAKALLKKAAIRYADVAGTTADFDRAAWNLFFAARVYALSIGWRPSSGKRWARRLARQQQEEIEA